MALPGSDWDGAGPLHNGTIEEMEHDRVVPCEPDNLEDGRSARELNATDGRHGRKIQGGVSGSAPEHAGRLRSS